MKKIGLLSDTHSFLDHKIWDFLKDCDEIWHAGDIGNMEVADKLSRTKPFKAVYGNIDGEDVRISFPKIQHFVCEELSVLMVHIGGYPGRYEREVKELIHKLKPKLFISGHSHILKVIYDDKNELLHMNPGAAGKSGFHKHQTAIRFKVEGKDMKDLEVFEKQRH